MSTNNQDTSRRAFLRNSAVAAGAVAAAGQLAVPQGVRAAGSDVIKFGIIGCGGRGTGACGQALAADKNNHLVAMADMFPDKLERAHASMKKQYAAQVKVTPEKTFVGMDAYKQLIDTDVDVVLLTTPPGFRPMHFKYAVEKNKHVFAEKPVCVDAAGYRSVLETIAESRKKNLAFVDGFCWRYNTCERATFPKIHEGMIGDVLSIYSHYNAAELWMNPRQPGWSDTEWQLRNWLYFNWLSGDHIVEQAVHTIDKVAWAMNDMMPVRAWGTGGRQVRTDQAFGHIYDHFAIVYEWESGARAHMYCRQQNGVSTGVKDSILGTKGTCDINSGQSHVIRLRGQDDPAWKYTGPKNAMYQQEHDELFASIRAGKPVNAGERVANSAMLAILGRMAAYTGQVVKWSDAIASKEDLFPKDLDLKGPLALPPVALPGKTKFV
jgi:myo-inositol 2-dehydrogenase/D-chiro-inositol 1-dehydrogenase